uniref:NADH-ubiquinone oxidoreductase chain 5 n=1 Tax=Aegorhinus superciliosus TaxID=1448030 RepID=A0A0K0K9H9_9CUCU|nr:NADH dehydrogenase subunit 5 [Aegorhinus superciliosus]AHG32668.1 NADH dehydrogenase subunit 5 [Aegorhinus superciliosus]
MMSPCKKYFCLFLYLSVNYFFLGLYFLIKDLSNFMEFNILSLSSVSIVFIILLDWMSLCFFISSLIINYSEEYMNKDKNLYRFILLVVMFVFSMMMMILSPNLISILLGWDGLGFVSYALVIYYQNVKSFNAGMLTALSNRLGDAALLIAITWMLNYGSWNFSMYLDFMKEDKYLKYIAFLIILAALTKSAQIPFSAWLPAAMAAPTPVSSLVHSSTLVTAGVYLLIRFNNLFSSSVLNLLLFFSLMTMFMAGLAANFEFDLKKIIAFSTLSQLGFMISILAMGDPDLSFFHLLTHALFKALLFMCAGMIIHNLSDCQDIRYMGGISKFMPLTCTLFNISNMSLCGLPFLSGFYSKDLIMETMSMSYLSMFIYFLYFFLLDLTVCYSFRLMYYSLNGEYNFTSLGFLNDENKVMLWSMIGLVALVIFMGGMMAWALFPTPFFICLPMLMKMLTLIMILMGIFIGYEVWKFRVSNVLKSLKNLKSVSMLAKMWNVSILTSFSVISYPLKFGKILSQTLDQGWFEFYGGKKLYKMIVGMAQWFQALSKNNFKIFLMLFVIWLLVLTLFIIY